MHPLVEQLRFARSEFLRGLTGLGEDDARRRIEQMNSISWNVGHMAWQEQRYWLVFGAGESLRRPDIDEEFRYGAPATTPGLAETVTAWQSITRACDPWLDTVTDDVLSASVPRDGKLSEFIYGSLMLRMIYHYWYHTGENAAIRQALVHTDLPEFVGDIDTEAPYRRG